MLLPHIRPLNNADVPRKDLEEVLSDGAHQRSDTLFLPKALEHEEPTNEEIYYPGNYFRAFLSSSRDVVSYHRQIHRSGLVIEKLHTVMPVYNGGSTNDWKKYIAGINEAGGHKATSAKRLRIHRYPVTTNSPFFSSAPGIRVYRDAQDLQISSSSTSRCIKYLPFSQYAAGALGPNETKEINMRVRSNDPLFDLIADELEKDKRFRSSRNLI
ncbi:hypothetical protein RUND412_010737 [Rhizina undulata]